MIDLLFKYQGQISGRGPTTPRNLLPLYVACIRNVLERPPPPSTSERTMAKRTGACLPACFRPAQFSGLCCLGRGH